MHKLTVDYLLKTVDLHNEPELLKQIAKGNEQAFNVMFAHYRERIFGYLLKITKSREVAEDLLIDIFMKLWVGRELLANVRDFERFLHKVAYNKAMDFFRITARHERLQKVYSERLLPEAEKGVDEKMMEAECRRLLIDAVNQLPPQRKLIYTLRHEQGLSYDQIAEALGLSRSTVKNTLTAAHRSLSEFLQKNYPGEAALSLFFFFY